MGDGAQLPTRPYAPEEPTLLRRDSSTSISVTWEPNFGDSAPITSCSVWWLDADQVFADEQGPFEVTDMDNLEYTVSPLISGNNYRFRVACSNLVGMGPSSSVIYIVAGAKPVTPINLSEKIDCRSSLTLGVMW